MKRKTIKSILSKRFDNFLKTIDDPKVKALIKDNSIITGGSIVSLLLNEPVNDFDIYFANKETVKAVCEYYCQKFNASHKGTIAWVLDGEDVELWKNGKIPLNSFAYGYESIPYSQMIMFPDCPTMLVNTPPDRIKVMINSDGVAGDIPDSEDENIDPVELFDDADHVPAEVFDEKDNKDKGKYRPIFLTTNAISLSNKFQLITRFYGDPEEIHKNYDFIHATCYWESKNNNLCLPARALEAIINKELFYTGSLYPIASVIRTRKFIKRGWQINAGQFLKMCMQISDLDLKNIAVLEDQLMGVDTIYFKHLIKLLQNQEGKDINSANIVSIIDKIF